MAKLRSQKRELRKVLAALAKNDRSTTEVVFNGFEIGSESLSKLAMNLLNNTVVKVVCLNDCGITSKGAALLAFALRSNTTLRHLWLNGMVRLREALRRSWLRQQRRKQGHLPHRWQRWNPTIWTKI